MLLRILLFDKTLTAGLIFHKYNFIDITYNAGIYSNYKRYSNYLYFTYYTHDIQDEGIFEIYKFIRFGIPCIGRCGLLYFSIQCAVNTAYMYVLENIALSIIAADKTFLKSKLRV